MTTDIQTQIDEQHQNLIRAEQDNDQAAQLKIWDNLGNLYSEIREYKQSLHAYQQAKAIASQQRDINLLFRIGISLSLLHEYSQSIDCVKEALQISLADSTKVGDTLRILGFLGDQYRNFHNDIPQAITSYQQALELAQKVDRANHQYWRSTTFRRDFYRVRRHTTSNPLLPARFDSCSQKQRSKS